jgi:flagellin-like protein
MYKKAVSPLIATVLLVMIVVSIGAAVMVVIQSLAGEGMESITSQQAIMACSSDVQVEFLTVGDSFKICVDAPTTGGNGTFALYLDNSGLRDISDWRFRVVGTEGIMDLDGGFEALPKGSIKLYVFPINETVGADDITKIQQIVLYPKITGNANNPSVVCKKPNLVWDEDRIPEFDTCASQSWDG